MRNQRLLVFLWLILCTSVAGANDSWVLKQDTAGVKIYQRPTPTGYALTRGELIIPTSMASIVTAMQDRTLCQRWVFACKQGNLIKQYSLMQRLDYTVISSPLWFADRDMYIYSQANFNSNTKTLTIKLTGKENYDQGQIGRVRVKAISGLWQLKEKSPEITHVLYQIHGNPQLPASAFLKAYMVESVSQTLNKLKRISINTPPDKNLPIQWLKKKLPPDNAK